MVGRVIKARPVISSITGVEVAPTDEERMKPVAQRYPKNTSLRLSPEPIAYILEVLKFAIG